MVLNTACRLTRIFHRWLWQVHWWMLHLGVETATSQKNTGDSAHDTVGTLSYSFSGLPQYLEKINTIHFFSISQGSFNFSRLFNTIWLHSPLSSFLDFSIGFFTLHPLHSCPHFLLTNPYTLLSSISPPLTLISSISSSKYFFNVLNTCLSRTHTKHLLGNLAALQMYFSTLP